MKMWVNLYRRENGSVYGYVYDTEKEARGFCGLADYGKVVPVDVTLPPEPIVRYAVVGTQSVYDMYEDIADAQKALEHCNTFCLQKPYRIVKLVEASDAA